VLRIDRQGYSREGCRILKGGADAGYATSAGFSPTFRKGIGMALVRAGSMNTGDEIEVVIRDRPVSAVVAKRPLYPYHG
jgi:aminomethyltransferase